MLCQEPLCTWNVRQRRPSSLEASEEVGGRERPVSTSRGLCPCRGVLMCCVRAQQSGPLGSWRKEKHQQLPPVWPPWAPSGAHGPGHSGASCRSPVDEGRITWLLCLWHVSSLSRESGFWKFFHFLPMRRQSWSSGGLFLAELGDTLNPRSLVVAHCVSGSRGAHSLRAESSSQRPRAHRLPSSHVPRFRAARPWVVAGGAAVLIRALASGARPSQGPPGMNMTGLLGPQCGVPCRRSGLRDVASVWVSPAWALWSAVPFSGPGREASGRALILGQSL